MTRLFLRHFSLYVLIGPPSVLFGQTTATGNDCLAAVQEVRDNSYDSYGKSIAKLELAVQQLQRFLNRGCHTPDSQTVLGDGLSELALSKQEQFRSTSKASERAAVDDLWRSASAAYKIQTELHPEQSGSWYQYGASLDHSKDPSYSQQQEFAFRRALEIDSNNLLARVSLGKLLLKKGTSDGIAQLETAFIRSARAEDVAMAGNALVEGYQTAGRNKDGEKFRTTVQRAFELTSQLESAIGVASRNCPGCTGGSRAQLQAALKDTQRLVENGAHGNDAALYALGAGYLDLATGFGASDWISGSAEEHRLLEVSLKFFVHLLQDQPTALAARFRYALVLIGLGQREAGMVQIGIVVRTSKTSDNISNLFAELKPNVAKLAGLRDNIEEIARQVQTMQ